MIDYKRLVEKTSIIYDRRRSRPPCTTVLYLADMISGVLGRFGCSRTTYLRHLMKVSTNV